MLNPNKLEEVMAKGKELLKKLPKKDREFCLSMHEKINKAVQEGRSSEGILKQIKEYASSKS